MKIISGAQFGADQGGLYAAERLGLETGGFCPKDCYTERGPQPELIHRFNLIETATRDYAVRTEKNVLAADATVIFGDVTSPGSRKTLQLCKKHRKPYLVLAAPDLEAFVAFIEGVEVLNCAGNRESKHPGIQRRVERFLCRAMENYFIKIA